MPNNKGMFNKKNFFMDFKNKMQTTFIYFEIKPMHLSILLYY